jgi:N-methylhydantoinase B
VLFREAVMGAWGAGFRREGIDGVANPAANISNAPIEQVEYQAPIVIERYELVPDSGGPGKWRGGMAVERQLRFLGERATLQLRSDRRDHPPYGLAGGQCGAQSSNYVSDGGRAELWPTKFTRPIRHGQALCHRTAGGGGYGDPRERDPAKVFADVYNGKVTIEAAARDYGVRILVDPLRLDRTGTVELRERQAEEPRATTLA